MHRGHRARDLSGGIKDRRFAPENTKAQPLTNPVDSVLTDAVHMGVVARLVDDAGKNRNPVAARAQPFTHPVHIVTMPLACAAAGHAARLESDMHGVNSRELRMQGQAIRRVCRDS